MKKLPAQSLMRMARMDCEAVSVGPFTPLVFERCEFIGGKCAVLLGRPTNTEEGKPAILWTVTPYTPAHA